MAPAAQAPPFPDRQAPDAVPGPLDQHDGAVVELGGRSSKHRPQLLHHTGGARVVRAEEDHEAASHAHEHPLLDDFAQLLPAGLEPAPGREHAPERRRLAVGGPVIFFPARDGMAAPRREISQERLHPLHGEFGVSENAPQHLRMEDRASVFRAQ